MTRDELAAIVEGIGPVVKDFVTRAVADLALQQTAMTMQLATMAEASKSIGLVRERIAVLETRAPIPGPAGPAGKDGSDGVGFGDLLIEHDGARAVTIKAARGDVVKVLGTFTIPAVIYRGVWVEGKTYEPGDGVTWAGSEWHCQAPTTTKPGESAKAWTLKVKRGRDGKDGKDGPSGPPGPAGRDWQQVYDETRRR